MAYKYKACESNTTGGCKAGIKYDYKAPDARDVLKRFLIAITPYMRAGVNVGGDLGVDALEVFRIWDEIGVLIPQTKAMRESPNVIAGTKNHDDMCSMKLDIFYVYDMITGYGVAHGLDEAWTLKTGKSGGASVVIQGFGCVGSSCAYKLQQMGYKVIGIADVNCLVTCEDGLDIERLVTQRKKFGELNPDSFEPNYVVKPNTQWLDMECDILVPAALEDVINGDNAHRVKASLIVEGANIPVTPEADRILFERGIDLAVDFTVNLGATRYYDSIIFNVIGPSPQEAIDDVEMIVRRDVKKVYEESKRTGRFSRDIAENVLFVPNTFDYPDN